MAGALTHIIIALIAATIVHFVHFKFEFSVAVFIGNLLPDAIKFGLSAIKQATFKVFYINQDSFYHFLCKTTSSYTNWFTLGFFILASSLFFYHFHYIKKKTMEEYDKLYVFLLIGVIMHLIIDTLIIENGPWI